MVLSWWSQELVRRPNNQNGQIQKLIFDPYFPLSSPFEKFWSIVRQKRTVIVPQPFEIAKFQTKHPVQNSKQQVLMSEWQLLFQNHDRKFLN